MKTQTKQIIDLHNKVDAIEEAIFDFDYSPVKNQELDEQLKNIYISLQNIKGLIYNDKINYKGVR